MDSRVACDIADHRQEMILNYVGEKVLGLPRSY